MSEINSIFVSLTTAGDQWGTDDHVYLGVVGTVGGREFALAVAGYNDFEPGTSTYTIGSTPLGGNTPDTAEQSLNSLLICLPNVTHVYLRKQGSRSHDGDDAWQLNGAVVYLMSDDVTRVFVLTGKARLGNEYGHKVWLAESAHSGDYRDARIPIEGIAECGQSDHVRAALQNTASMRQET